MKKLARTSVNCKNLKTAEEEGRLLNVSWRKVKTSWTFIIMVGPQFTGGSFFFNKFYNKITIDNRYKIYNIIE